MNFQLHVSIALPALRQFYIWTRFAATGDTLCICSHWIRRPVVYFTHVLFFSAIKELKHHTNSKRHVIMLYPRTKVDLWPLSHVSSTWMNQIRLDTSDGLKINKSQLILVLCAHYLRWANLRVLGSINMPAIGMNWSVTYSNRWITSHSGVSCWWIPGARFCLQEWERALGDGLARPSDCAAAGGG